MMRPVWGACAVSVAIATAFGELTEVTELYQLTVKNAGLGVTAVTEKQTTLPEGLPTPTFWFDCNQRTGWEFKTVNGTNFVTKIPSLVGDRFLTTDKTLPGTTWKGWASNGAAWGDYFPPALGEFDDLGNGGCALDFGPLGSRRAMVFNPHQYEGEDEPANNLKGIGTVITLYGSQEGGGYFLGGGSDGGYQWNRVFDSQTTYGNTTAAGLPKYWCPLMRTENRQKGLYIHNDFNLTPDRGAMSGGWEAIAFETDVASFDATGLGVGDSRESCQDRSAGMRIAEMMIFDSILTEEQLRRANVYLQQKWLNRAQRGWNGNANAGIVRLYPKNSVSVELNAPAGETLSVGTLRGGHYAEPQDANRKFVKTGAGTLKVGDASNYTGPIEVRDGTLALSHKPVPTVEELPMGVYVRLDASDPACLVTEAGEDGREYVKTLKNLADGQNNGGRIYARPRLDVRPTNPTTADLRPWVRDVGLASGRPIIDFGWRGAGGRYLVFGTNEVMTAESEQRGLANIHTAVALVRVEAHGGNLMDGNFARGYIWTSGSDGNYTTRILSDSLGASRNDEVYLNGRRIGTGNGAAAGGFLHRGYHVIAYRVRPSDVNCIGSTEYRAGLTSGDGSNQARGGVQLGEILLWNRPLTEAEILDASAYLAKKWLGAEMPGYKSGADEDIPDVQVVNAAADGAKIDVPAGETVNVRKLVTKAPAVKTGTGTLEIGPESDTKFLSVEGGSVRVVKSAPTVTETAAVAPGAAIHLDASAPETMRTSESDGRTFVELWYSKTGYEYAYQDTLGMRPWINSDDAALLNGKPVLDFGGYSIYSSGRAAADARYLNFSTDLDSVRSVFLVLGSQQGGGNPLGERYYDDGSWYDYLRYGNMEAGLNRGMFEGAGNPIIQGEVLTNGVAATYKTCPTGGYQLWELHPTAGTHISALAINRGQYMFGGCRIAEVIIYERPLSEREKVSTRNYLAAKWFPEMAQQELPAEPAIDTTLTIASVGASVDSTLAVDDPIAADRAVGSATLVKTGAETLSVRDASDFAGTLDVTEGTLALTGEPLEHEPALVTEGRILHLDATEGVLAVTNADNTVSVTNWLSKLGDGWAATPVKFEKTTMSYPTLMPYELNALPVVKLENNGWNGTHHDCLVFHKDGVQQNLGGIKSVFWVIGSQEGGGFVLGGGLGSDGVTHGYWFHRGGNAGEKASDSIINHNANGNLKGTKAVWKLNGETINAESTGLSGGYDRLSFVQTDAATAAINADGLAFDGRILNTPAEDYRSRIGLQRLAELIVYDRIVTDEERAQIEAYLAAKWGFQQKALVNDATVNLAADATLTTAGNQYVGKLTGSGTVEGDVTAGTLVAEVGAAGLTVDGTYTIAEGLTIELKGLSTVTGDLKDTVIIVLTADVIAGLENLASVVFTGDAIHEGYKAKLRTDNGKLTVIFKPKGMMLLVR